MQEISKRTGGESGRGRRGALTRCVTLLTLTAVLGVSGGIIPCWDAIAMLGFAIAAQRLWLGLPLLIAFSAGLAGVLVAIGVLVVLAKNRLGRHWGDSRLWTALPILSAAVLVVMGLWLCRDSLLTPGPG